MGTMDGWDIALLVGAGYVAATALVRLMIRRRDQMVEQFRQEVQRERRRREAQQRKLPGKRPQAA
jgi:hypothetical protein